MKNVTKINQVDFSIFKKTRVAAYCRVSTDSDEQELSLDTQRNHYESYIKANSEWEYAGIYYDDGISGTKTAKRDGLLRLVEDCEKGLIDLVITKSISRFSRNTTDCLALVRKLLNYDVYIIFEKENIHTASMESELMLAILASMAESEVRSISENEKWSIKKRFQNGTYIFSYPPYGYANVDGEMVIVPEQAEIVKQIFADCLAGKSTHIIAKELNERGIPSRKGGKWTGGTINGILVNEKYIGAALYQKTYTDENFKRKRNYGEEEQYYCEDHHEPIIDKDTFEKAKEAIRQRGLEKGNCSEDTSKYQNRYAMSGKIKCGECGRSFKRRYHYISHGKSYNAWCCGGHLEDSKFCSMKYIREDDLNRVFLTMMNKLRFGNDLVLKPLLISITTSSSKKNANSVEDIEKEMKSNEEQRKQLNVLLTKGYLERPVFAEAHNKLVMEYEHLTAKRDLLFRMDDAGYTMEQALKELVDFLNSAEPFTEWDEFLFERFIEKVKVITREEVEFEFKCGLKLKERID
nr:MAG TPA: integrase [Caudoviricetes sp.]